MVKIYDIYYDRFKLFLEPSALRDNNAVDPRLPRLPVCTRLSYKRHLLNLFPGRETSY